MNLGFTTKSLMVFFVGVLAVYLGVFEGIEFLRHRKGAWVIDFTFGPDNTPGLNISQAHLGLTNVQVVLRGEPVTNGSAHVVFDKVKRPIPFGRLLYEDLTFLPGVLTFDLYGHEVELFPRTLVADRREIPWRSDSIVELWPTNKPAVPPQPPKTR
jgi:hypothetical protein